MKHIKIPFSSTDRHDVFHLQRASHPAPQPRSLLVAALVSAKSCLVFLSLSSAEAAFIPSDGLTHTMTRATYREDCRKMDPLNMSFLSDLFSDAFSNDANLSEDRSTGQLEGPNGISSNGAAKTDMQKRWLQSQERVRKGAPLTPTILTSTSWMLDLYLAGLPGRDPSSDLYGSRINISTRDRSMSLGTELPTEPSVSVKVTLEADGVCLVDKGPFTSGKAGEWKLSEDGRMIRMSLDCTGYTRTVQTKGTLTKVFWSEEDGTVTETSSTYTIPPGYVYADAAIAFGKPGEIVMKEGGRLMVEEAKGLLGASTRMVGCGSFLGSMVADVKADKDIAQVGQELGEKRKAGEL